MIRSSLTSDMVDLQMVVVIDVDFMGEVGYQLSILSIRYPTGRGDMFGDVCWFELIIDATVGCEQRLVQCTCDVSRVDFHCTSTSSQCGLPGNYTFVTSYNY